MSIYEYRDGVKKASDELVVVFFKGLPPPPLLTAPWPPAAADAGTLVLLVLGAHGFADVLDTRITGGHQVIADQAEDRAEDQHGHEHVQAHLEIKHSAAFRAG